MAFAYVICGLAFGDEGKGITTAALVNKTGADLIVRYNGGAQCAHNVITSEGIHHTFAQFGSGSFTPGVKTYLSRFVLVNPVSMLVEAEELRRVGITDILSRTIVDREAVIITPFQRALNRLTEMSRGGKRHGSTGMGIGQTRADHLAFGDEMLLAKDLTHPLVARAKLEFIRELCKQRVITLKDNPNILDNQPAGKELELIASDETIPWYLERYKEFTSQVDVVYQQEIQPSRMIFEGAQGVLLDETHGFQPHVTWTDTTFKNAKTIIEEMGFRGDTCPIHTIGVVRSYYTRHGAGPFPSEDASLLSMLPEGHNKAEQYTGSFRVGKFDLSLFIYALEVLGGVDSLAINHMDVASSIGALDIKVARNSYARVMSKDLVPMLSDCAKAPVSIIGYGPRVDQRSCNIKLF